MHLEIGDRGTAVNPCAFASGWSLPRTHCASARVRRAHFLMKAARLNQVRSSDTTIDRFR
jgi:hypothetical protein